MPATVSVDDSGVALQSRPYELLHLLVAAPCGALIAWTLSGLILNACSPWSRDLVDVGAGANVKTGGIGAALAVALVWFCGSRELPRGSGGAAIGSLAAVGLALQITFFGAAVVSGVIAQAAFMYAGMMFGVPLGILLGGCGGFFVERFLLEDRASKQTSGANEDR